jgi:hypothetical protein
MLQYKITYQVSQLHFNDKTIQDNNIAIIGIFASRGATPANNHSLINNFSIDKTLLLEENLGGGAGFPSVRNVYNIFKKGCSSSIMDFLNSLSQEYIVLFNTEEPYSYVLMNFMNQIAIDIGKKFICISSKPLRWRMAPMRRPLNESWEEIKENAYEAILFNYTDSYNEKYPERSNLIKDCELYDLHRGYMLLKDIEKTYTRLIKENKI